MIVLVGQWLFQSIVGNMVTGATPIALENHHDAVEFSP
jgi:hypothetical protein